MSRQTIPLTLGFGLAALAGAASAQSCASRDDVIARLQSGYQEHLTARGLQQTRTAASVIEIWSSPDSGTFTVLLTNAQGVSCVVASGTHFFPEPAIVARNDSSVPG